jgi:hypothetical protein
VSEGTPRGLGVADQPEEQEMIEDEEEWEEEFKKDQEHGEDFEEAEVNLMEGGEPSDQSGETPRKNGVVDQSEEQELIEDREVDEQLFDDEEDQREGEGEQLYDDEEQREGEGEQGYDDEEEQREGEGEQGYDDEEQWDGEGEEDNDDQASRGLEGKDLELYWQEELKRLISDYDGPAIVRKTSLDEARDEKWKDEELPQVLQLILP